MPERELPWLRIGVAASLAAAILGVVLVVRGSQRVPGEPQPIDWNRQPCAHCQMLIGEPLHAAQLITSSGEVSSFDDPGCAFRYVEQHRPTVHRLWFRDAAGERWLGADEVAFTTGATTPMGSGLRAVSHGTPGAIDFAAARGVALQPAPTLPSARADLR